MSELIRTEVFPLLEIFPS